MSVYIFTFNVLDIIVQVGNVFLLKQRHMVCFRVWRYVLSECSLAIFTRSHVPTLAELFLPLFLYLQALAALVSL